MSTDLAVFHRRSQEVTVVLAHGLLPVLADGLFRRAGLSERGRDEPHDREGIAVAADQLHARTRDRRGHWRSRRDCDHRVGSRLEPSSGKDFELLGPLVTNLEIAVVASLQPFPVVDFLAIAV